MTNEPRPLATGKAFHKKVQTDWRANAEGKISLEHSVVRPSGRKGRVDILVDPERDMVALAEIKGSDWDIMTEKNVRRNVRRHSSQIWSYIDSQLDSGKQVCPGVIFPERPVTPGRLKLIEELFENEGIPVVWDDETIDETKKRHGLL